MEIEVKLKERKPSDKLKKAVSKRQKEGVGESITDAFSRIYGMKNSNADLRKLKEVEKALEEGVIGREKDKLENGKKFTKAEALRLFNVVKDIQRESLLQEMVDSLTDNYELIQNEKRLDEVVDELLAEDIIVFDVETTGTDVWNDYIVGHVLSAVSKDKHYYIPTRHETEERQLDNALVNEKLRPVYESEVVKKIAHNGKFDIHMLDREGVTLNGFHWDTQEAMVMLNENEESFALKRLVTKYLGIESHTYGDLFGKKGFHELADLQIALAYAAKDGYVTYALYEFQKEHMSNYPEMLKYYTSVEVPLIRTVVEMEKTGFEIDLEYAEKYGKELDEEIAVLHDRITSVLGDINLNSPVQLKKALEDHIGKELPSTDAKKVLKPMKNDVKVISDLLEYKEKTKLNSTYIQVLPNLIQEKTGKLHAVFNQNGAKTGRFSSGGGSVNLQNQPYNARKLFVAPEGYVILGGDWSQQEYRCLAYFTQDEKLLAYYNEGKDLYAAVASEIFDLPIEECGDGSTYRKMTKVILLATVYGTGAKTLAGQLGKSEKEAKKFLADFKERFPGVKRWIDDNQKDVQKNGFVWMDKKQRKRRLPHAKNRNSDYWYTAVFTQSTNARVQGSSAIQTKVTMNKLQELCERKTLEGNGEWRLWTVVHDEALLLVPETITQDDVKDFEDVMVNSYVFGNVPNKTDIEIMRRWGEGCTVDEWFETL